MQLCHDTYRNVEFAKVREIRFSLRSSQSLSIRNDRAYSIIQRKLLTFRIIKAYSPVFIRFLRFRRIFVFRIERIREVKWKTLDRSNNSILRSCTFFFFLRSSSRWVCKSLKRKYTLYELFNSGYCNEKRFPWRGGWANVKEGEEKGFSFITPRTRKS